VQNSNLPSNTTFYGIPPHDAPNLFFDNITFWQISKAEIKRENKLN
jgi:hypothetical protein